MMVVAAHVSGFELKAYGSDANWLSHFHDIGATGVDIFFAISGFIMVATTAGLSHGAESARQFLWRRAIRIYPPYLIITAALFAVFLWKPGLINSSQETPPDPLASFLLLPQPGLPLLLVGWTLVFEMYFYLIFTLGVLAPKKCFPYILGAWALTTGLLAALPLEGYFAGFLGNPLHFEFIFGAAIGHLVVKGVLWRPILVATVGLASSVSLWALMWADAVPGVGSDLFRVPTIGLALAVTVYGFIGLEHSGGFVFPRWLEKLGDSSYSLYLTHIVTIAVFAVAFSALPRTIATHTLGLAVVFASCILGGLFYHRLVEAPLMRVLQNRKKMIQNVT